MRHLLLVVLIFALNPLHAQVWSPANGTPIAGRYDDVFFINESVGWTCTGAGVVFKTTDGGENWQQMFSGGQYLRTIDFIDEQIGFVGTLDGGGLLKTEDGGENWFPIHELVPENMPGVCGLSHVGNQVFGVGVWSYPAFFIKSIDAGETWTYKDMSEFADALVEVEFLDENIGYASGLKDSDGAVILKTIDGGENWTTILNTESGSDYIWKLFFVSDNLIYGAVESFFHPATIVKSSDSGENWEILPLANEIIDIQGIGFENNTHGWAGPRNSALLETYDGGLTWTEGALLPNVNRFYVSPAGTLFAAGDGINKWSETIVNVAENNTLSLLDNLTCSPNPFSKNFNIEATMEMAALARLDLFSLDGKLLHHIHWGHLNKGNHQFEISENILKDIRPGNYIVLLRTSYGFSSVQVVKK